MGFNFRSIHTSFSILDDFDMSGSYNENVQYKMKILRRKICIIAHLFSLFFFLNVITSNFVQQIKSIQVNTSTRRNAGV